MITKQASTIAVNSVVSNFDQGIVMSQIRYLYVWSVIY